MMIEKLTMEIDLKNLYELHILISGELAFKLFIGTEPNKEPDLEVIEPIIRGWSDTSDTKSGKSLVRIFRNMGFTAFTESQLNQYIRNCQLKN